MRRHSFDGLSFFFGAVFLIAGLVLLGGGDRGIALEWIGPIVVAFLSVVIVLAAWPARQRTDEPSPDADEP